MNISFIDYGKREEKLNAEVLALEVSIRNILVRAGVTDPEDLNDLDYAEFDKLDKKYKRKFKAKEKAHEKATNQVNKGTRIVSPAVKKVLAVGLAGVSLVSALAGGYYFFGNKKELGKNDIPKEDTDSLDQPNNSKEPNVGGQEGPTVDNDGLTPVEPGVAGPQGEVGPATEDQLPTANTNDDSPIYNDGVEDEPLLPSEQLPVEDKEQKESLFDSVLTDINNDEQVYARAKEIKEKYYDVYLKHDLITIEDVEEQIRQIGAGVCNEVSYESANEVIETINNLMYREEGNATDRVNEVISDREETPGTLDLGIFCVDGTKGQMLLHQLSKFRTAMIQGAGKTDISSLQKDFTKLFLCSTLLQGYECIDINSLETGGMKYLTGIAFFNTATLCGDFKDVKIENPLTLEEESLDVILYRFMNDIVPGNILEDEVLSEMLGENELASCQENLNYLGTYFFQMISDNYTTKMMYDDNYSKGLK